MRTYGNFAKSACIHCNQCKIACEFLKKYDIDLAGLAHRDALAYHCFLCGRCKAVCPQKIDGRMIAMEQRREQVALNQSAIKQQYSSMLWEKNPYQFKNYKNGQKKSVLFPGCNFVAYYPKGTELVADYFRKNFDMGMVLDCCGKPISDLGLEEDENKFQENLAEKLKACGVEEVVVLCPNCYYYLKETAPISVVSVYEKLKGTENCTEILREGSLFIPCPDGEKEELLQQIKGFFSEFPLKTMEEVQCCGLGGMAGREEPHLAKKMLKQFKNYDCNPIYTYCASCAGQMRKSGCKDVKHLLLEILDIEERPAMPIATIANKLRHGRKKSWK